MQGSRQTGRKEAGRKQEGSRKEAVRRQEGSRKEAGRKQEEKQVEKQKEEEKGEPRQGKNTASHAHARTHAHIGRTVQATHTGRRIGGSEARCG